MHTSLQNLTAEQLKRAKWVRIASTTRALKTQQRDGSKVLAVVQNVAFMRSQCPWRTVDGRTGLGYLPENAYAMARAALLEAIS